MCMMYVICDVLDVRIVCYVCVGGAVFRVCVVRGVFGVGHECDVCYVFGGLSYVMYVM